MLAVSVLIPRPLLRELGLQAGQTRLGGIHLGLGHIERAQKGEPANHTEKQDKAHHDTHSIRRL